MDFNKVVVWAIGVTAIITLATTLANWIVWRGEFDREVRSNKKTDAEDKIRTIEREMCLTGKPDDIAYCMLTFSRYEALRERRDYEE